MFHHVDGAGFGHELIQDVDVVHLAVTDEDEGRDIAAQIEQRMQLHGSLGRAERRPWKDGEAEIDRGRIERVHGVLEIEPERLVGIEPPGDADQALREVAVDAPVPSGVGISQGVACDAAAKTQVIELEALRM